jgi:hypothetical protein
MAEIATAGPQEQRLFRLAYHVSPTRAKARFSVLRYILLDISVVF